MMKNTKGYKRDKGTETGRLDYQPLFGKMSPHFKDRTRETVEIEPKRLGHRSENITARSPKVLPFLVYAHSFVQI